MEIGDATGNYKKASLLSKLAIKYSELEKNIISGGPEFLSSKPNDVIGRKNHQCDVKLLRLAQQLVERSTRRIEKALSPDCGFNIILQVLLKCVSDFQRFCRRSDKQPRKTAIRRHLETSALMCGCGS